MMKEVKIWPKHSIEMLYESESELYEKSELETGMVRCYRCGKMSRKSHHGSWALSRQLDVHVCSSCGIDEALRAVSGRCLPILKWDVMKRVELQGDSKKNTECITLTSACSFSDLLKKNTDCQEICHMRAYYDGESWVQDWIPGAKYHNSYISDVKGFVSSFLLYPDMADEYSMRRLFPVAEATSDSSEVNLYSEQDSFYVRIRLIAKSKDFSVYLYFYEK